MSPFGTPAAVLTDPMLATGHELSRFISDLSDGPVAIDFSREGSHDRLRADRQHHRRRTDAAVAGRGGAAARARRRLRAGHRRHRDGRRLRCGRGEARRVSAALERPARVRGLPRAGRRRAAGHPEHLHASRAARGGDGLRRRARRAGHVRGEAAASRGDAGVRPRAARDRLLGQTAWADTGCDTVLYLAGDPQEVTFIRDTLDELSPAPGAPRTCTSSRTRRSAAR